MKPFVEFFLEYRQGLAKDLSIHPTNNKGANITIDPLKRKNPFTRGPYEKIRKNGDVLIGDELYKELKSLNHPRFENGKELKRKNTNPPQVLKLFINLHGQECGKVTEIK